MLGQREAILKRPPRGAGTGETGETFTATFTGTSNTAVVMLPNGGAPDHTGFWMTFIADQDCYIRVGKSNVGAATTSDYLLAASVREEWWCSSVDDTHFSVIQKSSAGTLKRYRSER